jgi:hypothetical protein
VSERADEMMEGRNSEICFAHRIVFDRIVYSVQYSHHYWNSCHSKNNWYNKVGLMHRNQFVSMPL